MRVRLHAAADAELSDAAVYLETERTGYGERFLLAYMAARDLVLAYPNIGESCGRRVRRKRIRGFRYDIIYRVELGEIFILAIAHHSRWPRYWQSRLG